MVIGLGRFGLALAQQLQALGQEVLGIDARAEQVQAASGLLTFVVQADATDPEVLLQLGVDSVNLAVVAIGDDMQSSILATASLADVGVTRLWAKAVTEQHATILERVGADSVVFPERDMGRRVAHRVAENVLEYFQVDDGFALAETCVPSSFVGRTLAESRIREDRNVTVVCVRSADGAFGHAAPEHRFADGDVVLVAGSNTDVERFAVTS